jgi:magnesium chelatase accessory protein
MTAGLRFDSDGKDWPNRETSLFIKADGLHWHVQRMGSGRPLLLIHGTGASSHSWRDVMPRLASDFDVIAPDLPGHGFTRGATRAQLSLPGMAKALHALLQAMNVMPQIAVGHSAGAVILLAMTDRNLISPQYLISFNGAFFPIAGPVGHLFSPLAKLLASFGALTGLFSHFVDRKSVERLLASTGSQIDSRGVALYERLFSDEAHLSGTLTMMAEWDLRDCPAMLKRLTTPIVFVKGLRDKTIPPHTADDAAALAKQSRVIALPDLGHLAHEEHPAEAATLIVQIAYETEILTPQTVHTGRRL